MREKHELKEGAYNETADYLLKITRDWKYEGISTRFSNSDPQGWTSNSDAPAKQCRWKEYWDETEFWVFWRACVRALSNLKPSRFCVVRTDTKMMGGLNLGLNGQKNFIAW